MIPSSLRSKFFIDGFFSPVRLYSPEDASRLYMEYTKYVDKFGNNGTLEGDSRFRVHLLANWAHSIVHNPTLVSAVKTVLDSPNILCWSSDICAKPANSDGLFNWHQDSTYSGLSPPSKVVTAWVALTPANSANGCMEMLPASHHSQLDHSESVTSYNLLAHGQYIPENQLDHMLSTKVCVELQPGEASLHSWQCVHRSGVNTTLQERVGLAVRYMTDEVENTKGFAREKATLVCGTGGYAWDLESNPCKDYGKKEIEHHKESMEREKANYFGEKETREYK